MKAALWIEKIRFKDSTEITMVRNSIVVFVGPNNSGKTQTLKEILSETHGYSQSKIIIDKIDLSTEGTADDFLAQIEDRRRNNTYYYHRNDNSGMEGNNLKDYWEYIKKDRTKAAAVSDFFIRAINTVDRLNLVSPAKNIDVLTEFKTHPIHYLKQDEKKENLFSDYFKKAFSEDIIVNHAYGSVVPMHVGTRPISTHKNDRVSEAYQIALRKLPLLHTQGDGMKSFAGVFLSLFSEDFSINLIDEPEAFLHPPQAALLGQMIAQLSENKQIFIATHSEHFLKGLLDSASNRLTVVRLQRQGASNNINALDNQDILNVWNDTLLRHSNVLDGLFHKKVVLAESDSDCRFYNAFATAISEQLSQPSLDILYIASGGKDRFPVVIKALKALEVPMVIIGDFDFYHSEHPLRKVYEELGSNWDEIKLDFLKVKKAVDEKLPELKTQDLKEEIREILEAVTVETFPEEKIKAIQAALKKASPWRQAKASGKSYLPSGEITQVFQRIQTKLKEKGIIILELGEIEAFDKSVGGHGPKWVNEVLKKDILASSELDSARAFVKNNILNI